MKTTSIKQIAMAVAAMSILSFGPALAFHCPGACDFNCWTFGSNPPEIVCDSSSDCYFHLLPGTPTLYYEVPIEGERCVEFWVYDPAKCLANPDPGYGNNGPAWGLVTSVYQVVAAGIFRQSYLAGCQGYKLWSTIAPITPQWFKDGLRGDGSFPWSAGWYKWTVCGTNSGITFTLNNVDYDSIDGAGVQLVRGDVSRAIDATSFGGDWASVFGSGWRAFWLRGDAGGGIEDICVDIVGGTGIFQGIEQGCNTPIKTNVRKETWGNIKALYK
jgi:hypothetical protein